MYGPNSALVPGFSLFLFFSSCVFCFVVEREMETIIFREQFLDSRWKIVGLSSNPFLVFPSLKFRGTSYDVKKEKQK